MVKAPNVNPIPKSTPLINLSRICQNILYAACTIDFIIDQTRVRINFITFVFSLKCFNYIVPIVSQEYLFDEEGIQKLGQY